MGPKQPHSTVLTTEEEALTVAFRRHTLLPLDDCLYVLQKTCHTGGGKGHVTAIIQDGQRFRRKLWICLRMKTASMKKLRRRFKTGYREATGGQHILR
jgi:hypothetical protein